MKPLRDALARIRNVETAAVDGVRAEEVDRDGDDEDDEKGTDERGRRSSPDAADERDAHQQLGPRHRQRRQVHERPREEPVVVDHVGEGGRIGDLRQSRHDEEESQRDLGSNREPGVGQGLPDRHAGPPVRTAPPRFTQSGKPSR